MKKKLTLIPAALFFFTLLLSGCKGNEKQADSGSADSTKTIVTGTDSSGGTQKTVYTCPMHPEVVSDKPGVCPKCGMDLEPKS